MGARARIDRTARGALGLEALRTGQRTAIEAAIAGRDVLAVMPTGYGKSAIYQVAGIERRGPTVVVAPLLALQADQVRSLDESGAPPAAALNSSLTEAGRSQAAEAIARGLVEYVFLAPEQLRREDTLALLHDVHPSLVVVDEAHCVSTLGHDFRPDYLFVGGAVRALGSPPTMALTATASPAIRDEIVEALGLTDPLVVVRGFDRPEIHLRVVPVDAAERDDHVVESVNDGPVPAIVYVSTRRAAETLAERLRRFGVRGVDYHGGMPAALRHERQGAFMDGDADVMVATNAFGLGIDKPDIRSVLHAGLAPSVDAYYQEVGRAGRDGEPARAVLFHAQSDRGRQAFLSAAAAPREDVLRRICGAVPFDGAIDLADVAAEAQVAAGRAWRLLGLLRVAGVVEVEPPSSARRVVPDLDEAVSRGVDAAEGRRAMQRSRLEMMRAYAETRLCRRAFVLGYFGEAYEPPCGACDVCDEGTDPEGTGEFPPGTRVRHPTWDEGTVLTSTDERIVVQFDTVGYRQLSAEVVGSEGLLRPSASKD